MNVIFLTICKIEEIESRGIYSDLMRKFRDEGHNVYIVTPYERQYRLATSLKEVNGVHILGIKTLNLVKTNFIEKGVGTILLERQFKIAIQEYLSDIPFDLILYSTPPITFTEVIQLLKRKNPKAISYLLLKDIFPQNAVDIELFSRNSIFYWYFRKKEIALYKISDYIGCMSPANVEFVLKHNDYLAEDKIEVAPNSIELIEGSLKVDRKKIRQIYNLPTDKLIFIYGGNLGKPQGIDFLIKCLDACKERLECFFLIIGDGTEYTKFENWFQITKPTNVSLIKNLPKNDYDQLVQSCDVGLIFLDHRFTIPNYPSRLLSYLEYKMPIIAATDRYSDVGTIAEDNGYGYQCGSMDETDFIRCVNWYIHNPDSIQNMGEKGYRYLRENYLVENTYNVILKHV